jgi:crotonobetainyl-CoA:carnitine CoA-transferase CaiB-like acyl-CoA transferase
MTVGPLADVVVLDLSRALAGPIAAMMMGDMGARVIKVETPTGGDDSRSWGPPFVGAGDDLHSTYFMSANRNKESVSVDLKSDRGHHMLTQLIRRADVLVENFRPGGFARLGFTPEVLEQINSRLITLSVTGFGHDGPEGARAGYDQIAQGEAGLMSVTGSEESGPVRIGVPIADVLAGIHGALGVASALLARQKTGRGAVVRTSLLAAAISAHAFHGTKWTVGKEISVPTGNHHPQIAPYGSFRTRDGRIQLAVGTESIWKSFATITGLDADDERFATNRLRVSNRDLLVRTIEEALAPFDRDCLLDQLSEAGVPAGAIRTLDEVYEWDQTLSQGLIIDVDHSAVGSIQLPGPAIRIETSAGASLLRETHDAPPVLGEDTEAVASWLKDTAQSFGEQTAGTPAPASA